MWSSDLAYVVGLIATDGCLSSDGRHLTVVSKDREQLENIQQCLKLKAKIKIHSTGNQSWADEKTTYYRLQWGDVSLYKFLIDIGLTPNKSLTLGALKVPDEYFFDFLRGSHDGDGCFYGYLDPRWKNSYMFYLTFISASPPHISWLQESTFRLCGVRGHITTTGKVRPMTNLKYAKRESVIVLAQMYHSHTEKSLTRKRLKIRRILGIVGLTLPYGE